MVRDVGRKPGVFDEGIRRNTAERFVSVVFFVCGFRK
jgi:hypothetical protein